MSPPIFGKNEANAYFANLIGPKLQQNNIDFTKLSKKDSLNIYLEIKKLLSMSRMSIDELGVSSVSNVTTPSQSVIEVESNVTNPIISAEKIFSGLNKDQEKSRLLTLTENINKTVDQLLTDESSEHYPQILEKYANIAEKCSQRISNLTAMIEKVREEKKKMLGSGPLLAETKTETVKKSQESDDVQKPSSSSSLDDEYFLTIDMSLANKLKQLPLEKLKSIKNQDELDLTKIPTEDDLEQRLKKLMEPIAATDMGLLKNNEKNKNEEDFLPILGNIPKVPSMILSHEDSKINPVQTKSKKPPPSKGILLTRKLTQEFTVPHELSTIPEQDSQTRLENSTNVSENKSTKPKPTPVKETEKSKSSENECASVKSKVAKSKSPRKEQISSKLNSFLANLSASTNSNSSSDEKLEMKKVEAMLRSIGMDWAISTVRKTQESLALTSSSSSNDMHSSSSKVMADESTSFMSKQLKKISSSTLRSDASPISFNNTTDISDIPNVTLGKNTSTPLNKNQSKQTETVSGDFISLTESTL